MTPCELTVSVTAAANAIACKLTDDQLNLLGVTLTQLGDTLITIATQRSICGRIEESKSDGERSNKEACEII